MALEEKFEITLDEEGAEKISTVQEAADLIAAQVRVWGGGAVDVTPNGVSTRRGLGALILLPLQSRAACLRAFGRPAPPAAGPTTEPPPRPVPSRHPPRLPASKCVLVAPEHFPRPV